MGESEGTQQTGGESVGKLFGSSSSDSSSSVSEESSSENERSSSNVLAGESRLGWTSEFTASEDDEEVAEEGSMSVMGLS